MRKCLPPNDQSEGRRGTLTHPPRADNLAGRIPLIWRFVVRRNYRAQETLSLCGKYRLGRLMSAQLSLTVRVGAQFLGHRSPRSATAVAVRRYLFLSIWDRLKLGSLTWLS